MDNPPSAVIVEPDPPPEKPNAEDGVDFGGLYRKEWDTWALTGKLGAAALRADLPDVVQGLKDGKIDPEQFAQCLTWQEMMLARQGVEKIPCNDKCPGWPTMEAGFVECLTRDIIDSYSESNPSPRLLQFLKSFMEQLLKELREAENLSPEHQSLQKYQPGFFGTNGSDWDAFRETAFFALLHHAFDRVCTRNKGAIKKLTGRAAKKSSLFQLYKSTKRHFDANMHLWFKACSDKDSPQFKEYKQRTDSVRIKRTHILITAKAVRSGDDVYNKMCWECNAVVAGLSKCGGCGEARYCCKEHQRQAWQEGHRHSCKLIKFIRESFAINSRRIETATSNDNIIDNFHECVLKPCLAIDTKMAWSFTMSLGSANKEWVDHFGHPTMDNFYQNLADIVKGERYFLFADTPDPTLRDTCQEEVNLRECEDANVSNICLLSMVMGYRLTSAADEQLFLEKVSEGKRELGTTFFDSARELVRHYKYCSTLIPEHCRKDIEKGQLYDLRRVLHAKYHKLQEKPLGYCAGG